MYKKAYFSKKREMYRLYALLWQNTNFSVTNKQRFNCKLVLMKRQTLAVGVLEKLYHKTCLSQGPQAIFNFNVFTLQDE